MVIPRGYWEKTFYGASDFLPCTLPHQVVVGQEILVIIVISLWDKRGENEYSKGDRQEEGGKKGGRRTMVQFAVSRGKNESLCPSNQVALSTRGFD